MKWQPINTAPRPEFDDDSDDSGPDILCFHRNSMSVRYWGKGEDDLYAWQPRMRGLFPTHWMPLPEPPNETNTETPA